MTKYYDSMKTRFSLPSNKTPCLSTGGRIQYIDLSSMILILEIGKETLFNRQLAKATSLTFWIFPSPALAISTISP